MVPANIPGGAAIRMAGHGKAMLRDGDGNARKRGRPVFPHWPKHGISGAMSPPVRLLCALLTLLLAMSAARMPAMAGPMPAPGAAGHAAMVDPDGGHAHRVHPVGIGHDHSHADGAHRVGADHDGPAPHSPARGHHDCLGCIAPLDIGTYRPARAPRLLFIRAGGPADTVGQLIGSAAPEPPPPRTPV
jgi:hypothetical protein